MDQPERAVAVARALVAAALDDHAHRGQVVDLVELAALAGHLVVDRVEVLRAPGDLGRDVDLVELALENERRLAHVLLAVGPALGDHLLDLLVLARMERPEREVLELPFDRVDAEAMGERRIDLERLARLAHLGLLPHVLDRPQVVEPVGELDQDHAEVLRHRDDELAVVLGLGLLAALELNPGQLGDALDELRDLLAELALDVLDLDAGVFDGVVEERGGDRRLVHPEPDEDHRDAPRVIDELLARAAQLPVVGGRGELEGADDQLEIDIGLELLVGLKLGKEFVDEILMLRNDCHETILPGSVGRPSPIRRGRAHTGDRAFARNLGIHASSTSRSPQTPHRRTAPARAVALSVQAASASGGSSSRRRNASDSSRLRRGPLLSGLRPSSSKTARTSGAQALLAAAPFGGEPGAELVVALVGVEDPAHDELGGDRSVPAVLLEPEGDVVVVEAAVAVDLGADPERDRGACVAAALAHAEAEVLAFADGVEPVELAVVDEERDAGVAETERRELGELLAERKPELGSADDRVDRDPRPKVVVGQLAVGVLAERLGERLDVLRLDREAGGGAVTAEALEVLAAGNERAVQIEHAAGTAGALPVAAGGAAGDQHDRTAVSLDEPGGDDADHALVPVLTGDDETAPVAAGFGPRLDLGGCGPKDPCPRRPAVRGSDLRAARRAAWPRSHRP